jgi:hypothetical protein
MYVSPYYCLFTTVSLLPPTLPEIVDLLLELPELVLQHFTTIHESSLLLYKCLRLLPLYYCLFTTASVLLPTIPAIVELARVRELQELVLTTICVHIGVCGHSRMRTLIESI